MTLNNFTNPSQPTSKQIYGAHAQERTQHNDTSIAHMTISNEQNVSLSHTHTLGVCVLFSAHRIPNGVLG